MRNTSHLAKLTLLCLAVTASAQTSTDRGPVSLSQILDRLDRLEKQNEELTSELRALRRQLQTNAPAAASDSPSPPLEERVSVVESRVEEQAQSKVEAAHRSPLALSGLVLFNAFQNNEAAQYNSPVGAVLTGPDRVGATLNQTILGFDFNGPALPGDGRVSGSLNLDFFGGLSTSSYTLHIRRGIVNLEWKDREFSAGQDKAIVSPRQPDSLSEVGYPPLSYAGNPWLWVPQTRFTEHFRTGASSGLDAQAGLLETSENASYPGRPYIKTDPTRPAFEGRVNWWSNFSGERRFEVAGGFHLSDSHIIGQTVPSRFGTLDWSVRPAKRIRFTGLLAGGENLAVLGGFSNAFTLQPASSGAVAPPYRYLPAHQLGGWTQLAFSLTPRLTLNFWGGLQAPRTGGLIGGALTHADTYASNLIFRFTPNVLLGAEILQQRFGYNGQPHVIGDHYDLSIGYLF